ncbi:Uncharacterized protein Fot_09353 [Forsythia ovata]|uniref:Uncharacterized protein n=1 Tax=Forsythia ovata TaxID=205694 RepID=A0ABD1WGA6_9LAMI
MILSSQHQSSIHSHNILHPNSDNFYNFGLRNLRHNSLHPNTNHLPNNDLPPNINHSHNNIHLLKHNPSSHQYPPYPQPLTCRFPSSSQFYYPQPYHPSLYPPVPYPHRKFSMMLNDPYFIQQIMSSDQRSSQHD